MTYIVFSNSEGIRELSPQLHESVNGFATANNDIAVFYENGNHILLNPTVNLTQEILRTGVLAVLINDTRTIENELAESTQIINELTQTEDSFYIIYHNSSTFAYRGRHKIGMNRCFADKIKGELESNHITNSPHDKLFKTLNPFNLEVLKKLIDIFPDPILEAKLELLHNCLHPDSIPPSIDKLLSKYNNVFETFKIYSKGKEFSDKGYLEALTQLRIDILGS